MRLAAVAALFLGVTSLLVLGGAVFGLFLFFPLFVLALVGVLSGLENRTVQQHDPSMDATSWREGSHATVHTSTSRSPAVPRAGGAPPAPAERAA